jgi:hypothetical protein
MFLALLMFVFVLDAAGREVGLVAALRRNFPDVREGKGPIRDNSQGHIDIEGQRRSYLGVLGLSPSGLTIHILCPLFRHGKRIAPAGLPLFGGCLILPAPFCMASAPCTDS